MPDKHLSSQFDEDLNSLCAQLLQMGGLVEQQVETAMRGFTELNVDLCNEVIEREKSVNAIEVDIDSACVELIARRQPIARDLRLVMAISKAITNLERAGDEAERGQLSCVGNGATLHAHASQGAPARLRFLWSRC